MKEIIITNIISEAYVFQNIFKIIITNYVMHFILLHMFFIISIILMHFHNLGNDNQEGVEEDFQKEFSTEFGEGPEAEAANISLEQGKHHLRRILYESLLLTSNSVFAKLIMLRPVRDSHV